MFTAPHKVSLITQTKAVLLEGMLQRRWQHALPGERILSRELRISRWTLRAALAELNRSGHLKISQGRPCAITPLALRQRLKPPRSCKVALLTPAPLSRLRLFVSLWVDELRIVLNEHSIQLNIHDSAKAYRPNSKPYLEELVWKHPHDDWLLLLSTQAMQEFFQQRDEFALVAGTRFEGIQLPAIDIAWHAAGVHAAHTLLGLGHRQIAFFKPALPNAGVLATEAGLWEAISKTHIASASGTVRSFSEDAAEICRTVDRVLAEPTRPTVFVGARAASMLTVFSHLMRLKMRIPQDISLLSFEWEPFLDMVMPRVAHYEIPPAQFAWQIARGFLRPRSKNTKASYIIPQFVGGSSLGRISSP